MKRLIRLLILMMLVVGLTGCNQPSKGSVEQSNKPLEEIVSTHSKDPYEETDIAPSKDPYEETDIAPSKDPYEETDNTPNKDSLEVKKIVAIDAGHQKKGDYEKEAVGPGAKETKAKVSSGTQGRFTHIPEYELNLAVSLMLKEELLQRGYEVVMIRETNDVNLSNQERAMIAENQHADILVRIHANGSENKEVNGILTLSPTKKNPYVSKIYRECYLLADCILQAMVLQTGANSKGIMQTDTMTGINWATMPVTIVEMGYMTNQKEDELMATKEYRQKLMLGIANGIDEFFNKMSR